MKEDFAPHELVLKLEKIGFNNRCFLNLAFVSKDNEFYSPASWIPESAVWTPLWQQIFKWFRDEYRMNPTIVSYWQPDWDDFSYNYQYQLPDEYNQEIFDRWESNAYETYEEARVACIEKLIEIIENEK